MQAGDGLYAAIASRGAPPARPGQLRQAACRSKARSVFNEHQPRLEQLNNLLQPQARRWQQRVVGRDRRHRNAHQHASQGEYGMVERRTRQYGDGRLRSQPGIQQHLGHRLHLLPGLRIAQGLPAAVVPVPVPVPDSTLRQKHALRLVIRPLFKAVDDAVATAGQFDRGAQQDAAVPLASQQVKPPRVGECRAAMECKVIDIVQFKNVAGEKVNGWLVLGEVLAVHIDKLLLKDGVYQTAAAYPILRAGGLHDYVQVSPDNMFQIARLAGASDPRSHGSK